jgi:hypothetical protein
MTEPDVTAAVAAEVPALIDLPPDLKSAVDALLRVYATGAIPRPDCNVILSSIYTAALARVFRDATR